MTQPKETGAWRDVVFATLCLIKSQVLVAAYQLIIFVCRNKQSAMNMFFSRIAVLGGTWLAVSAVAATVGIVGGGSGSLRRSSGR